MKKWFNIHTTTHCNILPHFMKKCCTITYMCRLFRGTCQEDNITFQNLIDNYSDTLNVTPIKKFCCTLHENQKFVALNVCLNILDRYDITYDIINYHRAECDFHLELRDKGFIQYVNIFDGFSHYRDVCMERIVYILSKENANLSIHSNMCGIICDSIDNIEEQKQQITYYECIINTMIKHKYCDSNILMAVMAYYHEHNNIGKIIQYCEKLKNNDIYIPPIIYDYIFDIIQVIEKLIF